MNRIICEICGRGDIVKINGLFVCQLCGIKYSTSDMRELFTHVNDGNINTPVKTEEPVIPETSFNLSDLYSLARSSRGEGNFGRAAKIYSRILNEDGHSWEAAFYSAYCSDSTSLNIDAVSNLILNISDPQERRNAINEVISPYNEILNPEYYSAVISGFRSLVELIIDNMTSEQSQQIILSITDSALKYSSVADSDTFVKISDDLLRLNEYFKTDSYTELAVYAMKRACELKTDAADKHILNCTRRLAEYRDEYLGEHFKNQKYLVSSLEKLSDMLENKFDAFVNECNYLTEKIHTYDSEYANPILPLSKAKDSLAKEIQDFSKNISRRFLII